MKMLTKLMFCVAVAGTIAPAFAFDPPQNYNHRDDHRDDHRDHRNDHRDDRHDDRRDWHDDHRDHRGPPPHARRWERGHRYDGRVVIVNDYRVRHLREPPRGYHWVRAEDNTSEFLLVAIATGIIADIAMQ